MFGSTTSKLECSLENLENLDISMFQAPEDLLDGCRVCLYYVTKSEGQIRDLSLGLAWATQVQTSIHPQPDSKDPSQMDLLLMCVSKPCTKLGS